MSGFYSIRKLAEAYKFSTEIFTSKLSVTRFPYLGGQIDYLNYHQFSAFYNFDEASEGSMALPDVYNQFIHSFVFCLALGHGGGLAGILFNSDRTRAWPLSNRCRDSHFSIYADWPKRSLRDARSARKARSRASVGGADYEVVGRHEQGGRRVPTPADNTDCATAPLSDHRAEGVDAWRRIRVRRGSTTLPTMAPHWFLDRLTL